MQAAFFAAWAALRFRRQLIAFWPITRYKLLQCWMLTLEQFIQKAFFRRKKNCAKFFGLPLDLRSKQVLRVFCGGIKRRKSPVPSPKDTAGRPCHASLTIWDKLRCYRMRNITENPALRWVGIKFGLGKHSFFSLFRAGNEVVLNRDMVTN